MCYIIKCLLKLSIEIMYLIISRKILIIFIVRWHHTDIYFNLINFFRRLSLIICIHIAYHICINLFHHTYMFNEKIISVVGIILYEEIKNKKRFKTRRRFNHV